MKLLLDTHAFIWWDDDYNKLSSPVKTVLLDPKNTIYLSLVSIWEMQIKVQLNKLKFDRPLSNKVAEQVDKNDLQLLPILDRHINEENDWFEEIIVDTTNPNRWTVYFTVLGG